MTAVVSKSCSTSTWLTGAAGLLILAAAVVMMVCAAPRAAAPLHAGARPATESVISFCGRPATGADPAKARPCRLGPSALSAWTRPYAPSMISPVRPAGPSLCPAAKPAAC